MRITNNQAELNLRNNSTNFKALEKMIYRNSFNPAQNPNHAKAVRAFLDSSAFKQFAKKHDIVATFYDHLGMDYSETLCLSYRKATNPIISKSEALMNKITNAIMPSIGKKNNVDFGTHSMMFANLDDLNVPFAEFISNISKRDIMKKFNENMKEYSEELDEMSRHKEQLTSIQRTLKENNIQVSQEEK